MRVDGEQPLILGTLALGYSCVLGASARLTLADSDSVWIGLGDESAKLDERSGGAYRGCGVIRDRRGCDSVRGPLCGPLRGLIRHYFSRLLRDWLRFCDWLRFRDGLCFRDGLRLRVGNGCCNRSRGFRHRARRFGHRARRDGVSNPI